MAGAERPAVCSNRRVRRATNLEYFSAGGVLALFWRPRPLAPWVVSAAFLMTLACLDVVRGTGFIDFILLGLAGYELVIGLTDGAASQPT